MTTNTKSIPTNTTQTQTISDKKYPVSVTAEFPATSSRLLALSGLLFFLKAVLIVPHIIAVYVLSFLALIVMAINFLIVLFTGKANRSLFTFILSYFRFNTRVSAYLFGLTDKYPPFRLSE